MTAGFTMAATLRSGCNARTKLTQLRHSDRVAEKAFERALPEVREPAERGMERPLSSMMQVP
jgi:hypothetical protein